MPTTLQGYSTSRATHVLPKLANNPYFPEGFEFVRMVVSPTELPTSGSRAPPSWLLTETFLRNPGVDNFCRTH